jgi:hypothetical protein
MSLVHNPCNYRRVNTHTYVGFHTIFQKHFHYSSFPKLVQTKLCNALSIHSYLSLKGIQLISFSSIKKEKKKMTRYQIRTWYQPIQRCVARYELQKRGIVAT